MSTPANEPSNASRQFVAIVQSPESGLTTHSLNAPEGFKVPVGSWDGERLNALYTDIGQPVNIEAGELVASLQAIVEGLSVSINFNDDVLHVHELGAGESIKLNSEMDSNESSAPNSPKKLVWIDLETGGLCGPIGNDCPGVDPKTLGAEHFVILEIGVHVTDADLNLLDKGLRIVVFHTPKTLENHMGPWSKAQFKNTLMEECQNPNHPNLQQAETMVLDYLKDHGVTERESPLCGNSIYLDRRYIETQMPKLNAFLHYRQLDVSSVGEAISRWYPKEFSESPEKAGDHSALGDIRESINELKFYKEACFK